jgi:hypothetical protein
MARLASGAFDDVRYQFSPHWVQDDEAFHCAACMTAFSLLTRRHHCRYCGRVFCDDCSSRTAFLPGNEHSKGDASVRLCDQCCDEVERAPHLDGRLSDYGVEQSSVMQCPANAVTRRLFSESGATPESMLGMLLVYTVSCTFISSITSLELQLPTATVLLRIAVCRAATMFCTILSLGPCMHFRVFQAIAAWTFHY